MRAVIKHLIESYVAIDDEIIVIDGGHVSVVAFDRKLAVSVANWLVRHMPDRNFKTEVHERFMDYEVVLLPKRRNG
jgi:hypothetical protein